MLNQALRENEAPGHLTAPSTKFLDGFKDLNGNIDNHVLNLIPILRHMRCFQVGLQRFEAAPGFDQGNHIIADLTLNGQTGIAVDKGIVGHASVFGFHFGDIVIQNG